ncbi:methionine ABC transporter substrate-binding protein [Malaciobacter halophilus]|uniref:Lipoprotein n=1 Tax=Malaciobacter halophilus TaxID=197482 RepID=A0A2N1J6Q0_9BACT|nr:MetQ/NlpA family ABC transporter substrate-binding protein [Malaciobacter halophilus]AXH10026.1 DL-methionine ABC transporter MetINQ, substrate-binding protein [Malaciobacter halophilus]PKI82240.1 methionine ABC transporter substrate-binding protein [Malaciobacter halophilus]
MNNFFKVALVALVALFLGACSDSNEKQEQKVQEKKVIKVGATPIPHAEILQEVKKILAKDGYTLEIVEFTDYVTPNIAVEEGELDANFFQHLPYMNEFNKNKNTHLVKTVNVHLEPMGVYSNKIKSLKEIKEGDTIAVPNDPTNESRALDILQREGLLTFKDVELKTAKDILDNPKNLKIEELDAPQLPRVLDEVTAAVINTNYALLSNLNPLKDALAIESKDSPYANIITVKAGNEEKPYIKALDKAINSEEIKNYIRTKYEGSIIEAF